MDNKTIGVIILITVAFIVKEFATPYIKKKIKVFKQHKLIKETMERENIDFSQAIEKMSTERLSENLGAKTKQWNINDMVAEIGDRIGFETEDGMITGTFLGLKESKAKGYTYHFLINTIKNNQNIIISMPIEEVYSETFNIYRRM